MALYTLAEVDIVNGEEKVVKKFKVLKRALNYVYKTDKNRFYRLYKDGRLIAIKYGNKLTIIHAEVDVTSE